MDFLDLLKMDSRQVLTWCECIAQFVVGIFALLSLIRRYHRLPNIIIFASMTLSSIGLMINSSFLHFLMPFNPSTLLGRFGSFISYMTQICQIAFAVGFVLLCLEIKRDKSVPSQPQK